MCAEPNQSQRGAQSFWPSDGLGCFGVEGPVTGG
jgi:hypothetical protein